MKLLSVCSARPNFVKLAAVHHAFVACKREGDEHIIVHTGQHYDPLFSDIFFEQLQIPLPDENLGVHGGTREEVIAKTQVAIAPVLSAHQPDCVLVYGDVNGAVGAAQAAVELGISIAHVEAGLRSYDMDMPEEHNRITIDTMANYLLCSEQSGMDNLAKEGVPGEANLVGNTMIDTLIRMQPLIVEQDVPADLPDTYAVVTMHRPSNVDTAEALQSNINFLNEIAEHCSLILPAHHRLVAGLEKFALRDSISSAIQLVDPLGYLPFLRLVEGSTFILTDSGGLQEEAAFLGKRCFTLRRNTERPSTIEGGSNVLIDPAVAEDQKKVLDFAIEPAMASVTIPELWDGKTGERIITTLQQIHA